MNKNFNLLSGALKCLSIVTIMYIVEISDAQNLGIGTTNQQVSLDVLSTNSYVSRFSCTTSNMFIGLSEGSDLRYIGGYSGFAEDVDFGTSSNNTTGKLHLAIKGTP